MKRILAALGAALTAVPMAGCSGESGGGSVSVEIDGPVGPAFTNGILTFQVDVRGRPERVELRLDGALLSPLTYPYLWAWDTGGTAEGTYFVAAVALDADGAVLDESEPVEVTVDRTAPVIVERHPAAGAENVAVQDTVTIVLDEPVDLSTVDGARIEFVSGNPVLGALASADARTLTLPAASPFLPVPNVAVVDLAEVRDRAGNPVDTGAWTYEIPSWLALGDAARLPAAEASEPAVAAGADGEPFVAFLQDAGASHDLVASRWNGTAWAALGGAIETDPALEAGAPVLAIDGVQSPILAWIEWDGQTAGARRELRAARWNGASWAPLGAALNRTAGDATDPVLLGDGGGGAPMLAWNEGGRIHVVRWQEGAWTDVGAASLPAEAQARGAYISAEGGTTRLAYRAPDGSVHALALSGDVWVPEGPAVAATAGETISVNFDAYFFTPVIATEEETSPGQHRLVVRRFNGAGEWYEVVPAPPAGSDNPSNPRLANARMSTGVFFPEGDAAFEVPPEGYPSLQLVWEEGGDVHTAIFEGFQWVYRGAADFDPAAVAAGPVVAHDGDRRLFLAWEETGESGTRVRVARMNN